MLSGAHQKVTPRTFQDALLAHGIGNVHHMAASAISIAQASEAGVVYALEEVKELSALAHKAGMKVHLDGARIANAIAHLGVTPADITWKSGIDILTFGTTKNGTMNAEAVITFDSELARVLGFTHKRAGHLLSKMRYMSAQLLSYLEGDLWQRNAQQANQNAARIARALARCADVKIVHPVHINEVFVVLPEKLIDALRDNGINLRPWNLNSDGRGFRLVASYCDSPTLIERLEEACRKVASSVA